MDTGGRAVSLATPFAVVRGGEKRSFLGKEALEGPPGGDGG